jgi:glycosyltransferase involved in cell wall biosynthesis
MNGLSAVIPIYNEETSLIKVISRVKEELKTIGCEWEIIAVNDGSSDHSLDRLRDIQNIQIVSHHNNQGYGASLKSGIKRSRYDWVIIIDADATYPTNKIRELAFHTDEYEQVVGARVEGDCAIPAERKLAKKILNRFAGYIAGCRIPDLNSGFRIFKKQIVLKYWKLFPDRFSFTSTLTMICLTYGYSTLFLPINYFKREGRSSIKSWDFFSFLGLIAKLALFFRPYKIFILLAGLILTIPLTLTLVYLLGYLQKFPDTSVVILTATALQTFFFGLIAEIILYNK